MTIIDTITNTGATEAGVALLASGGGAWAVAKAYLSLAGRKDDNKVAMAEVLAEAQQVFMSQQQVASDKQAARSDAEIERINQRLIASEATASERVTAVEAATEKRVASVQAETARLVAQVQADTTRRVGALEAKIHELTLEVASLRAELARAQKKAERYSNKADRAETEALALARDKVKMIARVAELEAEVSILKMHLDAALHPVPAVTPPPTPPTVTGPTVTGHFEGTLDQ